MKEIGGYFEFELQYDRAFPHCDGVLLNTGRNALEYIFRIIGNTSKVYIPCYTCHTVMQPINVLGLMYQYYHVNSNLEIAEAIELQENEYLIYTNYYGLKGKYTDYLYSKYGYQLIVDSAQAFFYEPQKGMNIFFTPHKFVGVTSGSITYTHKEERLLIKEKDETYDRLPHAFVRYEKNANTALEEARAIARMSRNQPIKVMSDLTKRLLRNLAFDIIRQARINNVNILDESLGELNMLKLPMKNLPLMVYPYWTKNTNLRKRLILNGIFVASYWDNVKKWCSPNDLDYQMVDEIIPLPIDQRYGGEDMNYIIRTINSC